MYGRSIQIYHIRPCATIRSFSYSLVTHSHYEVLMSCDHNQFQLRRLPRMESDLECGIGVCIVDNTLLAEGRLTMRSLNSEDLPQVKLLCIDCFPINYPESWFKYVTSGKVYSLGCFMSDELTGGRGHLVAMLISEEQQLYQIESEVGPILASAYTSTNTSTTVMYIISLGVFSPHRKQGLGSLLLNTLLAHVSSLPSCRAVYLHVQTSNSSAQKFYNQLGFKELATAHNYYFIRGQHEDAFLYCCYTNGGMAFPCSARGYLCRYYEDAQNCLTNICSSLVNCINHKLSSKQ